MDINNKEVHLRCDCKAEIVSFIRHNWKNGEIDYELTFEDSYCGGDYVGIVGRFKRAWKAFWAKPIYYSGVYCEDGDRMRKFFEDCLSLMDETESKKKKCRDCDAAVKDFFKCAPGKYVCIGVKEPFVIEDINVSCTEY